jgi:Na+:H+ antiporter, NhaA family
MSLFIGGLAFPDPAKGDAVKIGVLMGSIASALCGYLVLALANRNKARPESKRDAT